MRIRISNFTAGLYTSHAHCIISAKYNIDTRKNLNTKQMIFFVQLVQFCQTFDKMYDTVKFVNWTGSHFLVSECFLMDLYVLLSV